MDRRSALMAYSTCAAHKSGSAHAREMYPPFSFQRHLHTAAFAGLERHSNAGDAVEALLTRGDDRSQLRVVPAPGLASSMERAAATTASVRRSYADGALS